MPCLDVGRVAPVACIRNPFHSIVEYMSDNLIGVTVASDHVDVVLLNQTTPGSFTLKDETTFNLQSGCRASAYNVLHGQFSDYMRRHQATCVCLKGSAVSLMGTKLVHLEAAELRGVLKAAVAANGVAIRILSKAATSRTFGTRKVDAYLKDDSYWAGLGLSSLKKGMREAAFLVVAEYST